jgi:SpoVK/Ycf46/Vps4 family AAA+-type ATPase
VQERSSKWNREYWNWFVKESGLNPKSKRPWESLTKLNEAILWSSSNENHLTVLLIEKLDSLTSKINNFQRNKTILGLWLYSVLKQNYERTLIVCTSNNPSDIDDKLLRLFRVPLYLEHLNLESIKKIFLTKLKRKDSEQVAENLYRVVDKDGFKLVSAEVIKAIDRAITSAGFETASTNDAAMIIRQYIRPCYHSEVIKAYEASNKDLIEYSKTRALIQ